MDAGSGAQKAGDILIRTFAKMGKYVYIEPIIPAEISPPVRTRSSMSGVIIRIANFNVTNIGNNTDVILASHEVVLDRRLDDNEHNPNCIVFLDMSYQKKYADDYHKICERAKNLGLEIFPFDISDDAKQLIQSLRSGKNMYYLGILSCIYNIPEKNIIKEIQSVFKYKLNPDILKTNIKIFKKGYQYAKRNIQFSLNISGGSKSTKNKVLMDGNSALALGIIDAGIKLFSGYPITPASSIMHLLAKSFSAYGGVVHQAEDEIAAIGGAIGSYFGGVPAITSTSGPGLSLKQEFIGFATMTEIPLIIINVQRGGPSTGMPTKTEQSDLSAAIFGSHGDNVKIILSVSNILDCFYAPQMARYLTEKLHLPVIIMSDFQTANSFNIISKPRINQIKDISKIPDFVFELFRIKRLPKNIEMVHNKQSCPGTSDEIRRVTGLNTDETGSINYFAGANQRAHRIRNEKVHHVRRALTKPEMFGKDKGDILVISWGSTRGALEEAINSLRKQNIKASGLHLRFVYPLPLMMKDIFKNFKKVVTIELTYADEMKPPPLMILFRSSNLIDVDSITCRATGRPLRPKTIEYKIKELLNKK
ncbi:hypothetical protein BVX93_01585 [bacterium B13(2017)]|nr:hypothetical protein BVX93_01585 [bacterium B13(2017)]